MAKTKRSGPRGAARLAADNVQAPHAVPTRSETPTAAVSRGPEGRVLLQATLAGVLSALLAYIIVGAPNLAEPLDMGQDNLWVLGLVKSLADHGWYFHNPRLGLPGVQALVEFPMADVGHIAILEALVFCGSSVVTAVNVYYLLTFFLSAAVATWCLRNVGIDVVLAALGGITFALMPYHFLHGTAHLFLSGYFLVPLGLHVALTLSEALPEEHRLSPLACLVVCALTPAFGGYYAFFFAYLLLAATALQTLASRVWRPLLRGCFGAAVSLLSLLACLAPTLASKAEGTDHLQLFRRNFDAEMYALRLIQMVLPSDTHQTKLLADMGRTYTAEAPLINENQFVTLGLFLGSVFVTVHVIGLVSAWWQNLDDALVGRVMLLNVLAFLYGMVGGIGTAVTFYVSAFIRSNNRIVVFIAFGTIVAGMRLLQAAMARWCPARMLGLAQASVALAATALMTWDNHDMRPFANQQMSAAMYARDASFATHLEATAPFQGRIFQLPYVAYPEGGLGMPDYFHLRPYLHTKSLSYSFGAMRGTSADQWNASTSALASHDVLGFLERLRREHFDGILIARSIPAGPGRGVEESLQRVVGRPTLESESGEFAYYAVPGA